MTAWGAALIGCRVTVARRASRGTDLGSSVVAAGDAVAADRLELPWLHAGGNAVAEGDNAAADEPPVVAQSDVLFGPGRRTVGDAVFRHWPVAGDCRETDCAVHWLAKTTSAAQAAQPTTA